ncbi:unnamed protein product, partial [marine sediment metagenome]
MLGYVKSIKSFLMFIPLALAGLLSFLYKREKRKHKQTKEELEIANDNVELLVADKEITENIDKDREVRQKEQQKQSLEIHKELEALKNESNNPIVVNSAIRLL